MELSCDETTLLCEKDAARRRYADLLLRTAGSRIGFSTCLSASAKALRYRLKNTLQPVKRRSGYLVAGLFCIACFLFQGSVAFAYDHGTGADYIFPSADASAYTVNYIDRDEFYDDCTGIYAPPEFLQCADSDALYNYLISLDLYRVTGIYHDFESYNRYTVSYDFPEGKIFIVLQDNTVTISIDTSDRHERYLYYHGGTIDWAYFRSLLEPYDYLHQVEETQPTETQPQIPPLPPHK